MNESSSAKINADAFVSAIQDNQAIEEILNVAMVHAAHDAALLIFDIGVPTPTDTLVKAEAMFRPVADLIRASVGIESTSDGLIWHTSCSRCADVSQRDFCPHSLAVLRELRSRLESSQAIRGLGEPVGESPTTLRTDIAKWMANVAEIAAPIRGSANDSPHDERRLVFLVSIINEKDAWVRLDVRPAYRRHDEPVRAKQLIDIDRPSQKVSEIINSLTYQDRERLVRLRGARRKEGVQRASFIPRNAIDQEVFEDLLRDGLCILHDIPTGALTPLTLAPVRAPKLEWSTTSTLAHQLCVEPDRGHQQYVDLPKPMLLDRTTGVVTPLDITQPGLRALLQAPEIPIQDLDLFRSACTGGTSPFPIAPPNALGTISVKHAKPSAHVVLRFVERTEPLDPDGPGFRIKNKQTFIVGDVTFCYGMAVVRHDAIDRRAHCMDAQGVTAYERDLLAEASLVDHIYEAGLQQEAPGTWLYVDQPITRFPFAKPVRAQKLIRACARHCMRALTAAGISFEVAPDLAVHLHPEDLDSDHDRDEAEVGTASVPMS